MDTDSWETVYKVEDNPEAPDTMQISQDDASNIVDDTETNSPERDGSDSPVTVKMEFGSDSVSVWQDDPDHPIEIDLTESHIELEPVSLSGSKVKPEDPFGSPINLSESPESQPNVSSFLSDCPIAPGESLVRPVLSESGMGQTKLTPIDISSSPIIPTEVFATINEPSSSENSGNFDENLPVKSSQENSLANSPARPLVMLDKLPVNFKFDSSAFNINTSPSKETIQKSLARLGQAMSDAGLITSVKKLAKDSEQKKGTKRKFDAMNKTEAPQKKLGRPKKYLFSGDESSSSNNRPYWKKVSKSVENNIETVETSNYKGGKGNRPDYSDLVSRFIGLQGSMASSKKANIDLNDNAGKKPKGKTKKKIVQSDEEEDDKLKAKTEVDNQRAEKHHKTSLHKYFSVTTVKNMADLQRRNIITDLSASSNNDDDGDEDDDDQPKPKGRGRGRWKQKHREKQPGVSKINKSHIKPGSKMKTTFTGIKRPQGRPKKYVSVESAVRESETAKQVEENVSKGVEDTLLKRTRGRPRKSLDNITPGKEKTVATTRSKGLEITPPNRPSRRSHSYNSDSIVTENRVLDKVTENSIEKQGRGRKRKSLSIETQNIQSGGELKDKSPNSIQGRSRISLRINALESGEAHVQDHVEPVNNGIGSDTSNKSTTRSDSDQDKLNSPQKKGETESSAPLRFNPWLYRKKKGRHRKKVYLDSLKAKGKGKAKNGEDKQNMSDTEVANQYSDHEVPEPPSDHEDVTQPAQPSQETVAEDVKDWKLIDGEIIQIQSEVSSALVMTELNKLRKEGKLCDTVLQGVISCESFSEVAEVKCHSCILAALSLTCRDMFPNHNPIQSSPYVFRFEDTNRTSLMAVLDYLYTGKMEVGKKDVTGVSRLATKMKIESLIEKLTKIQESLGLKAESTKEKTTEVTQAVHIGRSLQSTFFMT